MKRWMNKRGFSIVEAIIAILMITLVTAAALSVVLSSILQKQQNIDRLAAQRFACNAWECFKASESEQDFRENMNFAGGAAWQGAEDEGEYRKFSYTNTENKFSATIRVKDGELFEITINDNKNKEILSFDYTKGSGIWE